MSTVDENLSLPPAPTAASPVGFPLLATVAPLAAAGLIWSITGSAFALIFAVLSPLIAVASMVDSRRAGRKRRRAETAAQAEAVAVLRAAITERQSCWRAAAWQQTPSARDIVLGRAAAARWRQTDATLVALGCGPVPSGIRLGGATSPNEHRDLRDWAATVTDAPIVVDLTYGLGIVGAAPLPEALARAVLVQLCFALPPTDVGLDLGAGTGWEWAAAFPHSAVRLATRHIVLHQAAPARTARDFGPGRLLIAVATRLDDLPPGCGTVVRVVGPGRAQVIRSPRRASTVEFFPELLSGAAAADYAVALARQARDAGLVTLTGAIPDRVTLTDLFVVTGTADPASVTPTSLGCVIGVGPAGPVRVDLVRAGPHAIVGGTTGSGKSELLATWVASLAATHSPDQVNFLLVDFKGGAAFAPLGRLPHCVGLITDLDSQTAARALASLGAELRFRERMLSAAGARDLTEMEHPLPRLVIVVDEFATMLGVFPELHALFVDIAARGRSLGVHLILCTQRPAGVARDALLANCSLRLSLRVNNRADSQAVIGTDAAATLDPDQPGRCVIATDTAIPVLCQIASTGTSDIRQIAASAPRTAAPRRPWLDALPTLVTEAALRAICGAGAPDAGYPLGLLDEPENQRYRVLAYAPDLDGHLLVVGGSGSGKSALLCNLAQMVTRDGAAVDLVSADVESTWDVLERVSARIESGRQSKAEPRLLLLDDFDSVSARWQPDHRLAAADLLTGLLRDGPAAGVHLVVAVQRLTSAVPGLASLCPCTLLLKLPSVQDHLAAGGLSANYHAALPAGGGVWRNTRVQLLAPVPAKLTPLAQSNPQLPDNGPLLVVSSSPARTAARLLAVLGVPVVELAGTTGPAASALISVGIGQTGAASRLVVVGDAETWQVHWTLLTRLRGQPASGQTASGQTGGGRASIVFDRCSLADFRMVSHRRELPPPLTPGRGRVWVLHPDGDVTRAVLPEPDGGQATG